MMSVATETIAKLYFKYVFLKKLFIIIQVPKDCQQQFNLTRICKNNYIFQRLFTTIKSFKDHLQWFNFSKIVYNDFTSQVLLMTVLPTKYCYKQC